jgi:hypothetical protein
MTNPEAGPPVTDADRIDIAVAIATDTSADWPSREQWAADAERSVRQSCYAIQRVSGSLSSWADDDERAQLVHIARNARLGSSRIVRVLERPSDVCLDDISHHLGELHRLIRAWDSVLARAREAAQKSEDEAVALQVEYRRTEVAWSAELSRCAMIGGWKS